MKLKNLLNKLTVLCGALIMSCTFAQADVHIDIDKSSQRMNVFVDDAHVYEWPISTGVSRYDTPSGEFSVTSMHVEWYSKAYDYAPMPHSIFFTRNGHAIHGTTEVAHLGLAASHGCVRLHPDNARVLYELVSAEGMGVTRVVVSGDLQIAEAPPPASRPRSKAEVAPLVPEQPPVVVEEHVVVDPPVIVEEHVIVEPPVIVEEYVVEPRWLRRQLRRERRWLRRQQRRSFRRYGW